MKTIIEFLEAVKIKTGSDYQTAMILESDRQLVSNWRRGKSFPTNEDIAILCDYAGLDFKEALFAIEASREKSKGKEGIFTKKLAELGGIAASILIIVTFIMTPTPSQAASGLNKDIPTLYIM